MVMLILPGEDTGEKRNEQGRLRGFQEPCPLTEEGSYHRPQGSILSGHARGGGLLHSPPVLRKNCLRKADEMAAVEQQKKLTFPRFCLSLQVHLHRLCDWASEQGLPLHSAPSDVG